MEEIEIEVNRMITVRLPVSERILIGKAAAILGVSMNTFIRSVSLAAAQSTIDVQPTSEANHA